VYTWLLVICAIPVLFIGTSHSYMSFLLFRLSIGVIGASFVITQFHTSVMFAPNIKGTANATAVALVMQVVVPQFLYAADRLRI
jgi:NNP family nitrate/nitrite transporter-like MFS transporter